MDSYARRHLVCASWHRLPEGWHAWTGMVNGYSTRPFCEGDVGHADDHYVHAEHITETVPTRTTVVEMDRTEHVEMIARPKQMTIVWDNHLGIPTWLIETTRRGVEAMREHGYTVEQILGRPG